MVDNALTLGQLLIILGLAMDFTEENQQFYSVMFLVSIPLMGVFFAVKSVCVGYFATHKMQKCLLFVRSFGCRAHAWLADSLDREPEAK